MTLNRSGTSYRLEWNSRSASAERMSHLIVICRADKAGLHHKAALMPGRCGAGQSEGV